MKLQKMSGWCRQKIVRDERQHNEHGKWFIYYTLSIITLLHARLCWNWNSTSFRKVLASCVVCLCYTCVHMNMCMCVFCNIIIFLCNFYKKRHLSSTSYVRFKPKCGLVSVIFVFKPKCWLFSVILCLIRLRSWWKTRAYCWLVLLSNQ